MFGIGAGSGRNRGIVRFQAGKSPVNRDRDRAVIGVRIPYNCSRLVSHSRSRCPSSPEIVQLFEALRLDLEKNFLCHMIYFFIFF